MNTSIRFRIAAIALCALLAFSNKNTGGEGRAISAQLPPMPEGVTSFAAATLGEFTYTCGGHKGERHDYSAEKVSGAFYRLNLEDGKAWEKLPTAPPAQGAPLVAHGRFLYRTGGMAARNHASQKQDLWSMTNVIRFNTRSGKWENFTPLPEARSSHDSVVVGDRLFVGGGWNMLGVDAKPKWFGDFLAIDLSRSKAEWKSIPQPFQRRALAMAAGDQKLYFIGGMDSSNKTTLAVDIYDLKMESWSAGPDLPDGKSKGFGCSAINQGGRIYVNTFQGDLLRLAADGKSWEIVGRLQRPRISHRIVTAGTSQIIALGGEDGEDKRPDLEVFTPILKQTALIKN